MKVSGLKVPIAVSLLCISITGCIVKPAPPPPPPPPAIAAQIVAAKNVFVSNLGGDRIVGLNVPGGVNGPYNTFYASLQRWGHFQLVSSPKQADLIFEISATEKPTVTDKTGFGTRPDAYTVTSYPAIMTLTVKDSQTGSILWTTTGSFYFPAGSGGKAWEKTFNQSIEGLTDQLKALVPGPAGTPTP